MKIQKQIVIAKHNPKVIFALVVCNIALFIVSMVSLCHYPVKMKNMPGDITLKYATVMVDGHEYWGMKFSLEHQSTCSKCKNENTR